MQNKTELMVFVTYNFYKKSLISVFVLIAATTGISFGQDVIKLKSGQTQQGEVQKIDENGTITFTFNGGTIPYRKQMIDEVKLEPREEFRKGISAAESGNFDEAIALLQPLVDKFLGIRSPWVGQAASELASVLAQSGKTFESEQLAERIIRLYPDSLIRLTGPISKARTLIVRGRTDEALEALKSIESELPVKASPTPREMQILGDYHLVLAMAQEKNGQAQEAFQNYLTVVAVYHNPQNRAREAQQKADALKRANPDLYVP